MPFLHSVRPVRPVFRTDRTKCGNFVDRILLYLYLNNFYYMYFFQKWLFPQKILKKSILLYSKRMVICNFNIQHNLAQNSEMCQKLPILMVNKMVKNGPPLSPPNWSNWLIYAFLCSKMEHFWVLP